MTQGFKCKKVIQQKLKERNNKPASSKKKRICAKQHLIRKNKKVVGIQKIEEMLSGTAVSAHEHMKCLSNKLK